jgi:multidrug efflux system outer membrane protein
MAKYPAIFVLCLLLVACGKDGGSSAPAANAVSAAAAPTTPPSPPRRPGVPFTPPVPVKAPKVGLKLDPVTLRKFLLRDDISVLESLNEVYKAKEEVTLAHANLLPSLNISALIGGGTFGLSGQITFLLPFLSPSNWYNLDASKRQLAANGYAFYLVEVNDYASAYSLYLSMLADQEIEENQQIHYGNIEQIRKFIQSQVDQGQANQASLQQATAQSQLAHLSLLNLQNTIAVERASIRKILGFPLTRDFYLDETHLPELAEENSLPEAILKQTFARSPETRQVDSLLAAADDGTWSSSFDFLGGGSGELNLSGGSSPFIGEGSATLGFGIFPRVEIAKIRVRELQLRRQQIYLEEAKAIETTTNALRTAKAQLADAMDAERNARDAYAFIQTQFAQNKATLNDVITASELVIDASITRISTRLKVDTQRVNLERILLAREFAAIPNCHLERVDPKPFGWFDGIFNPEKNRVSVDELCRRK